MLQSNQTKFCQSCIERGINPPLPASREWQTDIFYCDECFNAVLDNLTNISPAQIEQYTESIKGMTLDSGPVLDAIYKIFNIPEELQFDRMATVQRNYDKIFNFFAPAIINRTEDDLAKEIEQLSATWFYIKYRIEPLEQRVAKLKEERRKEKGLSNYNDSKEEYATVKQKKSAKSTTQAEKMAKTLGMTIEAYNAMIAQGAEINKKKREREFNVLAGNCPECGGSLPCISHP